MMDMDNTVYYSLVEGLPEAEQTPTRRPKPIILIVEDEDNLAELLALRLHRKQFSTLTAYDGSSACQMVIESVPDLILMDIMLPEMDGWEVCRFIRSYPNRRIADIPIIILSALCSIDTKNRGRDVRANALLSKPYDFEQIFTNINHLLPTTDHHS